MLILQRKKGQSLVIGGQIRITIQDTGSDWVKLAIDAPRTQQILRAELLEAAKANQEALLPVDGLPLDSLSKFLGDQNLR